MVERRLPKPKVAGSNPVFRSIKFPQNHRPQHPAAVFFLYCHQHPSGKRGSPQDLLHPPMEGRGGYKKARNTRADFEPEGREISVSSNPFFRSKETPKNHRPQHPAAVFFYTASRTRAENGVRPKTFSTLLWRAGEDITSPTFQRCAFSPRYHPTFRR